MSQIQRVQPERIIVVGHSLDGIDQPYFSLIDNYACKLAEWTIIYHKETEKDKLVNNLANAGIDKKRIQTEPLTNFFDLDDASAACRLRKLKYGF